MNLERAILDALNLVHPRGLRENVLLNDVRQGHPQASLTDLRLRLRALEAKEQVAVVNGEDFAFIKITAAGMARLAE